jgi:uncharacterized protein with PIN domain
MTLEEAYIRRKQENMALKRENASLSATIEALRKGTYSNPEKVAHLKKISELTRKLQEQERIKERYKTLYEKEKDNSYDLYGKIHTLEEKIQSLQWQVDCLEGKSSRQSITAKERADAKITALSDEVARLTALLNRDGTNTGTPTSKTPLNKKKVIPNSREKTDRTKGGQLGHPKHSMEAFDSNEITDIITHEMTVCPRCGGQLNEVRDIPKDELDYEVKVVKKRHIFKEYVCESCGKTIRAKDPSLKAENQYGPAIQATALALMNLGFVSINRTRSLLCGIDPESVSISEGYLAKLQKRHAGKLQGFADDVRTACVGSPLLYWDETVVFIDTSRACVRFYGNEQLAYYTAHQNKNLEGIMADNILPALPETATVMHDHCLINYRKEFHYKNVECQQHLERDLQKLSDVSHHRWPEALKELIKETIHKRKQLIAAGIDHFSGEEINRFMAKYTGLLESGYREYIKDLNSYYSNDENALLVRLREYQDNYTEWVRDFSVPITNNLSERALRFVKCKDKISGQFLSEAYAKHFAHIRTYIETCARNGVNEFQALHRLAQNKPYTLQELCTVGG